MPFLVIGKEDYKIDWYGAACGVGILNPPENQTKTARYFYFLKFPLLPPTQPPLRKLKDLESNQCMISLNPQFTRLCLSLEIESNGNSVFFYFFFHFSHPQPSASLSLDLGLSHSQSEFGLCCTAPAHLTLCPHRSKPAIAINLQQLKKKVPTNI